MTASFPIPRPLIAFEGSFPALAVHQMTPEQASEVVEGLQALIDGIPPAKSVAERADEIRTTTSIWRLEGLISELEDAVNYRSEDPDQRADAFLLNELRDALASTERFIGRTAAREAEAVASAWALQGVAGYARVSA